MAQAMNLSEAAHTLQAHLGPRFSASHAGGQQRLTAILRQQLHLGEQDARQAVAALVRRHVVDWIAEPSLSRPCPGILELCGEWIIRPDRLVG